MNVLKTNVPRQRKRTRWLWRGALLALLIWIIVDVFVPRKHSIRQFDPANLFRNSPVSSSTYGAWRFWN